MSDANVVQDSSLTLRSILDARLNGDPPILGAPVTLTVDSPHRGNQDEFRLNLFLYNIVQDESRRNSGGWVPLQRTSQTQKFAAEPLALRLYYLLTAFAGDGLTEHRLLGEAMSAFYQSRRIPEESLRGTLKTSALRAEFTEINLLNVDIDTIQKIWGSQTEPIRSSVAYELQAVFLDAEEAGAEVKLVQERMIDVVPFPYPDVIAPDSGRRGDVVRLFGSDLTMAEPNTGRSYLRFWFGDVQVQPLPGDQTSGGVNLRVPDTLKPGRTEVKLQLDRYMSRSVPFEVLS